MTDSMRRDIEALIRALLKFPTYVGVCFRGASVVGEHLDAYYVAFANKTAIEERSFLSTSLSFDIAINHLDNVMFEISSKRGRIISEYSAYPDEQEVLFIAGTFFRIMSIRYYDSDNVFMRMEEV